MLIISSSRGRKGLAIETSSTPHASIGLRSRADVVLRWRGTRLYKEPQVTQVIRSNRLRWLGHIWRSPENNQTRAYTFKNPMGSRTRGRPPTRWIDDVENDLKTLNILKTSRELLRIVGNGGSELWKQPRPGQNGISFQPTQEEKAICRLGMITYIGALAFSEEAKGSLGNLKEYYKSHIEVGSKPEGCLVAGSTTRRRLATDHVILNHGQGTWTTPELAPPLLTTTPHQRETFQLSTDLTCIAALHGNGLWTLRKYNNGKFYSNRFMSNIIIVIYYERVFSPTPLILKNLLVPGQTIMMILKPQLRPYFHQNLSSSANNLSTHFFVPEERSFSNGSHLIAAFMEMNKPTQASQRGFDAASTLPSDASSKRQATSQGQIATEENFHCYRPGCWQILVLSTRWPKTCSAFCPT
ncbi:endonuclease-reverse transcriptase [Trichonephila clavipes]|nr:endonuclease-reverse transcriptase [Trichonephila clavipes]